jgi:hypothetical protein
MASSSSSDVPREDGVSTQRSCKKPLPESVHDLLEVAIFSFGCQAGLRSNHKVRGDPVLEGVCAFFGRILRCSSPQTLADFESISASTFGGWTPGNTPSKELLTLVSSRLKTLKNKGAIRENDNPEVPHLLQERKQKFITEEDRVKTFVFPKCWRCAVRCAFCRNKKKYFPNFGDFRVE